MFECKHKSPCQFVIAYLAFPRPENVKKQEKEILTCASEMSHTSQISRLHLLKSNAENLLSKLKFRALSIASK